MKTLVLGATENPNRYANMAIKELLRHGHEVVAIGRNGGNVMGVPIHKEAIPISDLHTVTLYLNPKNQQEWLDYIVSLKPKRIIYNPGTENEALERMASENGIKNVIACTLVMLSVGTYKDKI